ncbi:MAG: hypothetical protein INH41_04170 [Myxococcaceae bacterium]|nr:hypothetical protein [Myxococcaceae bacterium]
MKPLLDTPAKNDDVHRARDEAGEARARRREGRDRQPRGPAWATARDAEGVA